MITRKIFDIVLWDCIEDYVRLIHILPSIYNEIDECYDDQLLDIAKKILYFYVENGYVSLFYEYWSLEGSCLKEIYREDALYLILCNKSWYEPEEDIFIVASATSKGENLYNSGEIMSGTFCLPNIIK